VLRSCGCEGLDGAGSQTKGITSALDYIDKSRGYHSRGVGGADFPRGLFPEASL